MYVVNDDKSIYVTRGDEVPLSVMAEDEGKAYIFQPGDVVRIKVFAKKDCDSVALQKDFPVTAETDTVEIFLDGNDTKIGKVISKPVDYWYEVELNPETNPITIIGYDEDGAKVFKLFPEGRDLTEDDPIFEPDDIPIIDEELDLTSERPVRNMVVARAMLRLEGSFKKTNQKSDETAQAVVAAEAAIAVERQRIDNLIAPDHLTGFSHALNYLGFITEATKAKIDGVVNSDGVFATITVNLREANLVYGGTTLDVFIVPDECRPIKTGTIHTEDGLDYIINYDTVNKHYYLSLKASEAVTVAPSGAGSVTMTYALGDYETKDIRVGADGVVYDSAGTAIRQQFIKNVDSKIAVEWTDGRLLYPTNGKDISDDVNFSVTNYIGIRGAKIITANIVGRKKTGVAFYDEYMNYLSGVVFHNNELINMTIPVPSEAHYFRCGTYTEDKENSFISKPVSVNELVTKDTFARSAKVQARISGQVVDFDTCPKGYVTGAGGIELKGVNDERYTEMIPVKSGENYHINTWTSGEPWIGVGLFDTNKRFIKRDTEIDRVRTLNDGTIQATKVLTVEEGVGYIIVSARKYGGVVTVTLLDKTDDNNAGQSKVDKAPVYNFCPDELVVKSVNHRGYNYEAPENTLSAYKLSKQKGFHIVEADVAITSDGVPVLLHDDTIDRTSNGSGAITELTFDYVRSLDFGGWFNEKYIGEKIPSFEEFIRLCKYLGLHAYIELKAGGNYTIGNIRTVLNTVKKYAMCKNVSYISFELDYLTMVKDNDENARVGYIVSGSNLAKVEEALSLRTGRNEVFIDADFPHISTDFFNACRSANIPLEVWTVNNKDSIISLNPYISGVTSDVLVASDVLSEYATE